MRKSIPLILLLLVVCLNSWLPAWAQSMRGVELLENKRPFTIIDYASDKVSRTFVPLRKAFNSRLAAGRLSASQAVIEVEYINFTDEQRTAFQYAVDIWATLLSSPVPIRIRAEMKSLDQGVLGQTGVTALYANFPNAQKINTYYVVAMAEKIAGKDLNGPDNPDIVMSFNTQFDWYFGLDGNVPNDKYDFVSVILHEIGHGLGFFDGFSRSDDGNGFFSSGAPVVYDRHIETNDGTNLVDNYENNSAELGAVLVGGEGKLNFSSFSFPAAADRPVLYTPVQWSPGSSIAHLDESTYSPGNANSLMSPQFDRGEAIHDPGLALEMMADMGWVSMTMDHNVLLDSEDSITDREVLVRAYGDSSIVNNGVSLHYTYSDFSNEQVIEMLPTANVNEYSAIIPATGKEEVVKYFISVATQGGQEFTSPGEAPKHYWDFSMAKDTIAPTITHNEAKILLTRDPQIELSAIASDNIGLDDLILEYRVNGGTTVSLVVQPASKDTLGNDVVSNFDWKWDLAGENLVAGDNLEYRLVISDIAGTPNTTYLPETGFYQVTVVELNPVAYNYINDFNDNNDADFIGNGFRIGMENGFANGAIHSDHPYRVEDGKSAADTLTLIYMLKTPIRVASVNTRMSFDEVVLIEPGDNGTVFGDDHFWDYVIVEASKDLGRTWRPVADGYDSRQQQIWLDKWESEKAANGNSNAVGTDSLYVYKEIDITANGNFNAGDTLLFRFRIYIDPLAHGWGWAIDNLKIQIDDTPPLIQHIPPSYLSVDDTNTSLVARITDNAILDSVVYEIRFNESVDYFSFSGDSSIYQLDVTFGTPISNSDVFKYRIIATDSADTPNTAYLPASGYFEIPVVELAEVRDMYVNDFDTPTQDFFSTSFSVVKPDSFDTPGLMTFSPYIDSPIDTSRIYALLKYPIRISDGSSYMQFDEIVLTEPWSDVVVVEASKDNGQSWLPLVLPYHAEDQNVWRNTFNYKDDEGNSLGVGRPDLLRKRLINLKEDGMLSSGDEVLFRFSMTITDSIHGWGWFIDNLEIQGPVTGLADEQPDLDLTLYPNPASGFVQLRARADGQSATITLTDMAGRRLLSRQEPVVNNSLLATLPLNGLRQGLYLVTVTAGGATQTKRLLVE